MFIKFSSASVIDHSSTRRVRTAKTASSPKKCGSFEYEPNTDGKYLYAAVRACTADVPNLNYDMLPHEELKTAYKSFIGASIFLNHDNQDPEKARGVIIDAKYHDEDPQDRWIECLMEFDEERCPKLCSLLRSGEIDTFSMGCFTPGTKITLGDGTTKKIEDITVGDMVLTHEGNIKPVITTMVHKHNGVIYEVSSYAQPTPMRLTEEHPVWVRRPARAAHDTVRARIERNNKEIRHTCLCGRDFATANALSAHLREVERWGHDGEHGRPPEFEGWVEAKDLEIGDYVLDPTVVGVDGGDIAFARLLGYYLAEGNFGYDKNRNLPDGAPTFVEWNFHENEVEYHQEVMELIEALGYKPVGPYFKNTCATIRCNSPELAALMLEHGGKYSWGKKISQEVMRWGVDAQYQLLEAYLNGDGHYGGAHHSDEHFSFASTSKDLAEQIFTICVRCGVRCSEPVCRDYSDRTKDSVKNDGMVERRPFYTAQGVLGDVNERSKKLAYVDDSGLWRRITKIRMVEYDGDVYNFEVADDNSYVAEGCAVHNCSVRSTTCSICGNEAEYPYEFCTHIQQKGREFNGKLAYEICNGIEFFELSVVYEPADPTAYTQQIMASKKKVARAHANKMASDWDVFSGGVQKFYQGGAVGQVMNPGLWDNSGKYYCTFARSEFSPGIEYYADTQDEGKRWCDEQSEVVAMKKKATQHTTVINLQGEEYEDAVGELIRNGDYASAIDYLSQWDYGAETDNADEYWNPSGEIDRPTGYDQAEANGYTLVYNDDLSQAVLYRERYASRIAAQVSKTDYVNTLPSEVREQIADELAAAVPSEFVDDGMAGRICDLEDTVDIYGILADSGVRVAAVGLSELDGVKTYEFTYDYEFSEGSLPYVRYAPGGGYADNPSPGEPAGFMGGTVEIDLMLNGRNVYSVTYEVDRLPDYEKDEVEGYLTDIAENIGGIWENISSAIIESEYQDYIDGDNNVGDAVEEYLLCNVGNFHGSVHSIWKAAGMKTSANATPLGEWVDDGSIKVKNYGEDNYGMVAYDPATSRYRWQIKSFYPNVVTNQGSRPTESDAMRACDKAMKPFSVYAEKKAQAFPKPGYEWEYGVIDYVTGQQGYKRLFSTLNKDIIAFVEQFDDGTWGWYLDVNDSMVDNNWDYSDEYDAMSDAEDAALGAGGVNSFEEAQRLGKKAQYVEPDHYVLQWTLAPQAGYHEEVFDSMYELQDFLDENPDAQEAVEMGYATIIEERTGSKIAQDSGWHVNPNYTAQTIWSVDYPDGWSGSVWVWAEWDDGSKTYKWSLYDNFGRESGGNNPTDCWSLEDAMLACDSAHEQWMGHPDYRSAADAYTTAPRAPEEISTVEDESVCPLCGSDNFDGEFCDVCNYQVPPEGFDDIEIEQDEDSEEGADGDEKTADFWNPSPLAEGLMDIDNTIWSRNGWNSGNDVRANWDDYVNQVNMELKLNGISLDSITPVEYDDLTDSNFHSLRKALEELSAANGAKIGAVDWVAQAYEWGYRAAEEGRMLVPAHDANVTMYMVSHGAIGNPEFEEVCKSFARGFNAYVDKEIAERGILSSKKAELGFAYDVVTDVDPSWSAYDKTVAETHLMNYGEIYVDEYGTPIDNEYDLMDIENERGKTARVKTLADVIKSAAAERMYDISRDPEKYIKLCAHRGHELIGFDTIATTDTTLQKILEKEGAVEL